MNCWKHCFLIVILCVGTQAAPAGPLIIDPTIIIDDNLDDVTRDTRLQNATKWGSDATLMVGKKSDSVKKRSLLKFDFAYSGIPGNATILNALLQLYYYDAQRAGSSAWVDRSVQAHQVLNNWDELQADSLRRFTGTNWIDARGKIGSGSNPASEDANGQFESTMLFQQNQTNTWKVWNLTALTQKWLNGTVANYGVILWATNEDVNAYDLRFYSRENATNKPKLVVTWSNTPKTVYFLKDHLGSVRTTVDQTGAVVGYDDYDAWGYTLGGRTQATQWTSLQAVAKNKFTGKERDDNFGINWDYFGARYYDAQIGRWMTKDPLAEKYPSLSPYIYAANNPNIYYDPDGRKIIIGNSLWNRFWNFFGIKTEYQKNVETHLTALKNDHPELKSMIEDLEVSENIHYIVPVSDDSKGNSNAAENSYDYSVGTPTGSTTEFDPNNEQTVTGDERHPRASLAHELSHAQDKDTGKTDFGITENGIPMREVKAVNIENKARAKTGDKRRTTYAGRSIPPELLTNEPVKKEE